ncbi:SPOR domain-containing protein [Microbacterium oleivorans]|uniref:SPOR domain-containing protein n=1 Tax=Microbacterium oleivorans TaxID=273677 RepID=A0A7D5EZ43_9MICO|nr:SPOR domain-containing protein [Microbacterium oleivorans]QLD12970.1 SPOR domain-containing protein [Microbacterium oleivorans]
MPESDGEYWYNLVTHEVERGKQSPGADRAGPFTSAEEAARAPQLMADRAQAWREDEAREDDWDAPPSEGARRQ